MSQDKMSIISDIDETGALEVFHALMNKFGWMGTIFNRNDVESNIDRSLTDDEWRSIRKTESWNRGALGMVERGWDFVDRAIDQAGLKKDDEDDLP